MEFFSVNYKNIIWFNLIVEFRHSIANNVVRKPPEAYGVRKDFCKSNKSIQSELEEREEEEDEWESPTNLIIKGNEICDKTVHQKEMQWF